MRLAMRRLALVLLAGFLAVVAPGCGGGGGGDGGSGNSAGADAPEPTELALGAFRAAEEAGSLHYSFEANLTVAGSKPIRLTVEGDAGGDAAQADVSFAAEGMPLAGTILYAQGGLFIRFMG